MARHYARHLRDEGARIIAADINETRIAEAVSIGASIVAPEEIHAVECDIFSPCALGGVLNDDTIPQIKAPIVAGAANNQLDEPRHAEALAEAGILYAPDYAINPGGVITVTCEVEGKSREAAMERTGKVYDTLLDIFARAKDEGTTTAEAADRLAEDRIRGVVGVKGIWR